MAVTGAAGATETVGVAAGATGAALTAGVLGAVGAGEVAAMVASSLMLSCRSSTSPTSAPGVAVAIRVGAAGCAGAIGATVPGPLAGAEAIIF